MLLMDVPYTEDQLVPNFVPNQAFVAPIFEPQQSLPDFDSLLNDLSATFGLPEYSAHHNVCSPIQHSMDCSQVYPGCEDITFYDENVQIKREPEDFSFQKLKAEDSSMVIVKQEVQSSLEQEFSSFSHNDPMLSESPQQVQAMVDVKREMDSVCGLLNIPGDPYRWSLEESRRWTEWVLSQYKFQGYYANLFVMDGTNLCMLSKEAFKEKCPEAGQYLYEELQIWRDTYSITTASSPAHSDSQTYTELETVTSQHQQQRHSFLPAQHHHLLQYQNAPSIEVQIPRPVLSASPSLSPAPSIESLDSSTSSSHSYKLSPASSMENLSSSTSSSSSSQQPLKSVTPGKHNIQLWQFLRELLMTPVHYGQCIRWLDRSKGIFKIEDSQRVARLWGQRKNRPAMNYDKLSRSVRQYYKKGIIKKTDNSKRLVYQFCPQYRI